MRRTVTIAATLLLLSSFSVSVIALRQLERLRPHATLEEVLYIPSPRVIQKLSLGYGALLADIYWTRAVQYFGLKHSERAMEYKLLYPLLDISTTLDPKLFPAYEFGSIFLTQKPPQGAGQPHQAITLLQRGIQNFPDSWELYRDLGFIYYMELKDYPAAGKAFAEASTLPDAHPFMKVMAARTLELGENFETAQMLWASIANTTEDPSIRDSALKHLRALQVDSEVTQLENLVSAYHARTGQWPQSFQQLVDEHYLRSRPFDPIGNPYELGPEGRVQVKDFLNLPFIRKGLPPGQEPSDLDYSGQSSQ